MQRISFPWRFLTVILSATVMTILAWVSYHIREDIYNAKYDGVKTLAEYMFLLRVLPVSISIILALISSFVILQFNKLQKKAQLDLSDIEWGIQYTNGGILQEYTTQIQYKRPNLEEEIEREAPIGPMHVQVCGPSRMITSVVNASDKLKLRNHKITLDIHDSAL